MWYYSSPLRCLPKETVKEGKVSPAELGESGDNAKSQEEGKQSHKPEGGYPRARNVLKPTIPSPHPEVDYYCYVTSSFSLL